MMTSKERKNERREGPTNRQTHTHTCTHNEWAADLLMRATRSSLLESAATFRRVLLRCLILTLSADVCRALLTRRSARTNFIFFKAFFLDCCRQPPYFGGEKKQRISTGASDTHTHSHSLSLTNSYTLTHTHPLIHTPTHTYSLIHTDSLIHTHSYTHTHTHTNLDALCNFLGMEHLCL